MAIRIPQDQFFPQGVTHSVEVVHAGWRYRGDTSEEILSLLIDGYDDQSDVRVRRDRRLELALQARSMVQAMLNAGELFEHASPAETAVLLDRSAVPPKVNEWQCATPLTLIAVFYQPVGQLPQPLTSAPGQIWWIDPSTAQSLLETLHQVRWLDLTLSGVPETWETGTRTYQNLGTNGAAGYRWRTADTRLAQETDRPR